jgi:dipeptidyl aminopeptidase/acylaminoacyl peptidase
MNQTTEGATVDACIQTLGDGLVFGADFCRNFVRADYSCQAFPLGRWSWFAVILILCAPSGAAKKDNLPRLPGALLLTGYLPHLFITAPDKTLDLQENSDDSIGRPSMSLGGEFVAAYRSLGRDVISTYSINSRKWTDYRAGSEVGGALAVSPDGSTLAFAAKEGSTGAYRLHLIDLKTKTQTIGLVLGKHYLGTTISWSPDGRRIAFDMDVNRSPADMAPMIPRLRPAIHVLDLETGKISMIADGRAPDWSPSGEWIAYLHYSADKENRGLAASLPNANQVCVVRPDGTSSKVLVTLTGDKLFAYAPVWSPDSKSILLNKVHDELKFTMDIYLLDLATLKMTRKFKDAPAIYGWAEAK